MMFAKQADLGTAALGVLPIGRGNDFNYSMGNTTVWQEGCRVLAEGKRQWLDIGRVTGGLYPDGRYFGNGVGVGFDAVVGFIAARQRLSGFLSYLVAAIRTMYVYSPAPVVAVELEGETITLPALMVTIMNGRRLGGGFMIAPDGNPADGLMDVCIAHEVGKLKIFYLITKFMKGTQYGHPAIQGRQASRLSVRAVQGKLPVHADGETISTGCDQIQVELLPRQIEMYLP
jgi:diacylglycerol kinase family enzyme